MKRFWLVLLSLGLVMAFSASVFAADVKFTGSFYAAGMYLDDTTLMKDATGKPSTAFYYQRLRVQMEFIATPALKLVTRFDAMERAWGAPRTLAIVIDPMSGGYGAVKSDTASAGTTAENENIAFDWAYIQYVSKVGVFMVGYMNDGAYGTVFGDNAAPLAKVQYVAIKGPITAVAYMGKSFEGSRTAKWAGLVNSSDTDKYVAYVNYAVTKDVLVGLLGAFYNINANRAVPSVIGYIDDGKAYAVNPFFKAKFGPVALEGEALWLNGKLKDMVGYPLGTDIKLDFLNFYLDAAVDLGMFYAGGTFAYMSGDKPGAGKWEGGQTGGGFDWNPCLIMFNFDRTYWAGSLGGYGTTILDNGSGLFGGRGMFNAWFYQGRVGVRPVADLDIMASLAYANADKRLLNPTQTAYIAGQKKDYGLELDVTATYRITNNLSYMLGVGYLWTGDYFKYGVSSNKVNDNYLVLNKLTLTF